MPPEGISGTDLHGVDQGPAGAASVHASAWIAPREARTRRISSRATVAIQVGGNRLVRRRLGQEEGARLVGHGRDRLRGGRRRLGLVAMRSASYGGEHRGGHGSAGLWHHRRHAPAARAVVAAARCPRANPHRRLPPLALRRARAALRRLRGPSSLVGHRRRRVLAIDLGPLRRALRDRSGPAMADPRMPGARWFPGARLNWAEHCLRFTQRADDEIVIIARSADSRAGVADGGRAA